MKSIHNRRVLECSCYRSVTVHYISLPILTFFFIELGMSINFIINEHINILSLGIDYRYLTLINQIWYQTSFTKLHNSYPPLFLSCNWLQDNYKKNVKYIQIQLNITFQMAILLIIQVFKISIFRHVKNNRVLSGFLL